MHVRILVAHTGHIGYAEYICDLIYRSALERGTGIACRPVSYIKEKSQVESDHCLGWQQGGGFSYIETGAIPLL